ncbi:MAG TPA: phosphate regulon sensor histidine kinase PhoR [Spongiibacteraceae bacterium]|jgi:two-component system phosphate regulon sensor histidine kinase PhoR|nr:phosphate regulon sensor histidine kinase PhoR [Spongiibacteraceae bacterium]HUH38592.1 phosphate regulon sensor histidine kinase PhoR [Spongiibacteraceae bacterium]
MHKVSWTSELGKLGIWLLLSGAVALPLGLLPWALFLTTLAYFAMFLHRGQRLHNWLLQSSRRDAPEMPGIWGVITDQIYRRQRQQRHERARLRAQISYLRDCFMACPFGVVVVDSQGLIEWINPQANRLLGLHGAKDEGQHLLNLVRSPAVVKYFDSEQYDEPLEISAPGQAAMTLRIRIAFFGQRSRMVFVQDVTHTARLEQVRKAFVANVSHELRTPLTVIHGYLETMRDSDDMAPRWQRPLQQMLGQSLRMQQLIDDLLLLSRLEALPAEEQQTQIDMRALLYEIRQEALLVADGPRDIEIACDDSLALLGNRAELHSAFTNLVVNAVQHSPSGSRIQVRWFADSGHAWLQVEDNGAGIERHHIPRLTERFYRVDASRSTRTGGTGLGLAIVKHVLLRHQAELRIDSRPGKGSVFSCVLPLARTVSVPRAAQRQGI